MKRPRMATARSRMGPQELRKLAPELPDCRDRRYYLTVGFDDRLVVALLEQVTLRTDFSLQ